MRKKASRRRIKARAKLGEAIAREDIERHDLWAWTKWFHAREDGFRRDLFVIYDPTPSPEYLELISDTMRDYSRFLVDYVSGQNELLRQIEKRASE